ncbi:MAG: hypothetical protein D6731_06225 [Planctomycetota bacterium]|nr:MAG: hypothetical protein D6731_06225 [Planctomycetota bacterium]
MTGISHWEPSKWLVQSAPPDMAEGRTRWTFGVYEILDVRRSPVDPRVIHAIYRGVVELDPEEVPDPQDPTFTPRLEEAVIQKWKQLQLG